jgi:hypothetical protein
MEQFGSGLVAGISVPNSRPMRESVPDARHAHTSENSRHASITRVNNRPDVMLHLARETANKFVGCFIAEPIRQGTLTGRYSPRE